MSRAVDQIYDHLARCAEAGLPCPTNDMLIGLVGWQSPSAASVALGRLEAAGRIIVQRGQASRIVTIVATGKRTAGEVPRPHWRHMTPEQRDECAERRQNPRPNPRANKKEFEVERALERMAEKDRLDADAAANWMQRDPCLRCGVKATEHEVHGCRRYTV